MAMRITFLWFICGVCFYSPQISAQFTPKDSFAFQKHRHLKANITMTAFNISLNRFNRHVLPSGRDWANISFQSWKTNLGRVPEWDWDLYSTNWFAHPYQGSIYYNCARSMKMNYVQSMGYALLGTSIWEYLGEVWAPSRNDFITTTIGGIYLGEVLFRLSENIRDDRAFGNERLKKEIFATLLNPVSGVNGLFYDRLANHENFINHIHLPVKSRLSFSGLRVLSTSNPSVQELIPAVGFDLEYGERTPPGRKYMPFEYFWLQARFRFDKYDQNKDGFQIPLPYFNVNSTAVLYGKVPRSGILSSGMTGLFQHYTYLKTFSYHLSAISFSFGAMKTVETENVKWDLRLHAGPMVLGAINSIAADHIRPEDEDDVRDYVMGPGFTLKVDNKIDFKELGCIEMQYDFWRLYPAERLKGNENVHFLRTRYLYPVSEKFSLGVSYNYYHRTGNYSFPDYDEPLKDHNSEVGLSCYLLFE